MDLQGFWELMYFPVTLNINYVDGQPDYLQFVFGIVTLQTFVAALVIAVLFYNVLNNITDRMANIGGWLIFMALSGLIGFYFAFSEVGEVIYYDVEMGSDGWIFAVTNMVWAMVYYFIFSMICKFHKISVYGNMLPFKTSW